MPSVLNQLLPMIKPYNERTKDDYTCEDFLVLLVYMYSVVGEIKSGKELDAAEEEVKAALVKAICVEPELSPLLQKITVSSIDRCEVNPGKSKLILETCSVNHSDFANMRSWPVWHKRRNVSKTNIEFLLKQHEH
ncbi:hypothetical protein AAES_64092 [Amazona aestiva]|uniref:Uncharacterized protein n=1 Tax=Amazona aestiva TaxID=12930 RepID=A0A0Q3MKM6_AMAAE|nr:hypothetical protein AAES_64092 [Amazona aestiva]